MHLFAHELVARLRGRDEVDADPELPLVCELANQFLLSVPPPEFNAAECDGRLSGLLANSSTSLKVEVAERLAHLDHGPEQSVRMLAMDRCPEVARPILRYSTLLTEADLAIVARLRSEPHLEAIASRHSLTSDITDLLIARGTPVVFEALARNSTARFTSSGLRALARRNSGRAFEQESIVVGRVQRDDICNQTETGGERHGHRTGRTVRA